MSKLQFTVRTLKSVTTSTGPPLTKEVNQPLVLEAHRQTGKVHVVLEFAQTCKIKNIIIKNAGSAFMSVCGGGSADYAALAAAQDPYSVLPSLPALVPDTQLCSPAQQVYPTAAALRTPQGLANPALTRVRVYPAPKLSRYVRERAFKFLVIELRPFVDAPPSGPAAGTIAAPVGISWVEVYGEMMEESAADANAAAALEASAKAASRASTAMASAVGGEGESSNGMSAWAKDPALEASQRSKRGLEAFKPTGSAERLLAEEMARAPPRKIPAVAPAANGSKPILDRNATFMQSLRDNAASPSGAAATAPASAAAAGTSPARPLVCPRHPREFMVERVDRKANPPRTFAVCMHKEESGERCDTKIYK